MIDLQALFESHLTVANLQRSMEFYGGTLGLEIAKVFVERKVAFYWIGGRGTSMLGLWDVGTSSQRLSLHIAFELILKASWTLPHSFRLPKWSRLILTSRSLMSLLCSRGCLLRHSISVTLTATRWSY